MEKKELDYINQLDVVDYIKKAGDENWFDAYKDLDNGGIYCTLITKERLDISLSDVAWDLSIGSGLPSCSRCYGDSKEKIVYYRYGDDNIQPLVIYRNFNDLREPYIEISEEFRHFHNLFYDSKSNKYIKFDENGDEEDIIIIEKDNTIKIKMKAVKQFLAIKEMYLLIFFDVVRKSKYSLEELNIKDRYNPLIKENNFAYSFSITKDISGEYKTFSRICGKKFIEGFPKEKSDFWPYNENKTEVFDEFIIGTDENGDEILYTSNPDELANYFGANKGAPNYLTPVFFTKEVLNKYYADTKKYSVSDGYISCSGLWGLRLDNNHPKYVTVFLGDLGRDLNHKERLYWKSFNVQADAGVSEVCWKRSFEGMFCNPQSPDLLFRQNFQLFCEEWKNKYKWDLFLPLSEDDKYHYKTLRLLHNNTQNEFDEQIRGLVKILVDSINERQLQEYKFSEKEKSISILDNFLSANNLTEHKKYIDFLRKLQDLRSCAVAHRKGKNYQKISNYFEIDSEELQDVFIKILNTVIGFLDLLSKKFLNTD